MRLYLVVFFLLSTLYACTYDYDLRYELVGTDTIELISYKEKDTVKLQYKTAINQLIENISENNIKEVKCNYSGKLIFHKARANALLLEIEFSIQKDFAYIKFKDKNNKVHFRKINQEGIDLLFTIKNYAEVLESFIE